MSYYDDIEWDFHFLNNDRYLVIKMLGFGGYSSVWLSYDIVLKKYFAIKISKSEDGDYEVCENESKIYDKIKKLNSDYLIKSVNSFTHDYDDNKYFCTVLPLVGLSLYKYIKKYGKLDHNSVFECVKKILTGLDTLHSNKIIHGDIKPENILMTTIDPDISTLINKLRLNQIIKNKQTISDNKIKNTIISNIKKIIHEHEQHTDDGSTDECSINSTDTDTNTDTDTDTEIWSINSSESDDDNTNDNTNDNDNNKLPISNIIISDMGNLIHVNDKNKKSQIQTQYYMSPEVILRLEYDTSCDMWALGCTIYELLSGKLLFRTDDDNNEDRKHLHLINEKIGYVPHDMIIKSRYRDVLYTKDMNKIKGYNDHANNDIIGNDAKKNTDEIVICLKTDKLCESCFENDIDFEHDDHKKILMTIMKGCFEIDPTKRIKSHYALELCK